MSTKKTDQPVVIANVLLVTLMIVIPTAFGVFKMPAEMGLSAATISLAYGFWNVEKFSKIKAAGFEAELRDVVVQAHSAIEELRHLGMAVSAPIIASLAIQTHGADQLGFDEKMLHVSKIIAQLRSLGASSPQIEQMTEGFFRKKHSSFVQSIMSMLVTQNPDKAQLIFDNDAARQAPLTTRLLIKSHGLKSDGIDEQLRLWEQFHKEERRLLEGN